MQDSIKIDKGVIWASVIVGLLMILLSLRMMSIFPAQAPLPAGFTSPIIAFEFAKSATDIMYLTGDGVASIEFRDSMRAGHQWDMLFPFAYAGFLFLLLLGFAKKRRAFTLTALVVAVSIIPFDINENLVLLGIVDAAQLNTLHADLFASLYIATWLKWGAIAFVIFALGFEYLQDRRWLLALLALIHVVLAAACFFIAPMPELLEAMALSLSVFFIAALVLQVRQAILNRGNS
jgi:hypothetical protein